MKIKIAEIKKIIDEEFIAVARDLRRLTESETARALRTLAEQPDDEDLKPGDYLEVMVSDDGYETSAEPIQPAEYKNQRSYSTSFKALVKVEQVAKPDMTESETARALRINRALRETGESPPRGAGMSPKEAQARLETILKEVKDNSTDQRWTSKMAGEGLDMLYTMIGRETGESPPRGAGMSPKEAQARLETILEEVEDNSPDDWASNMAGEGLDMLYTMIGSPGFGKDSGAVDDAVAAMTEDEAARKRTQDRIRSRQKPVDTESVVVEIEGILNGLLKSPDQPQGLDNEGLKEILTQILKHLDQGFVGEPT